MEKEKELKGEGKELFSKPDSVIFSGVAPESAKLPWTFDGIGLIAKLVRV
ncbi:hypothetical protein [Microbulbifer variabilis]|nr:hypothetical protein [Microbulbifer variabilis]